MTILGYNLADVRKAIMGGLAADVALLVPELTHGALTRNDYLGLAGAFITAAAAVFATPHSTPIPKAPPKSTGTY